MALATPNQLYRLNKLGCLRVDPEGGWSSLDHQEADLGIKEREGTLASGALASYREGRDWGAVVAGTQDAPSEL